MKTYSADSANKVWFDSLQDLIKEGYDQESRNSLGSDKTVENLHVAYEITDPRKRHVHCRPANPAFFFVEIFWILAGRRDKAFLTPWNPRMKEFSDDGETFHGAYGWRLRGHKQDQLMRAYNSLMTVGHSRQVVLQIWDSEMDLPTDGTPRSKDIPCNVTAMLKVRDGKLHWHQTMRSNDIIFGTPTNFEQWTTVMEVMAGWLGLELGSYTHWSDSLHLYDKHWEHAKQLEYVDFEDDPLWYNGRKQPDLRLPYGLSQTINDLAIQCISQLAEADNPDKVNEISRKYCTMLLDEAERSGHSTHSDAVCNWDDMLEIIVAERVRRLGKPDEALDMAATYCENAEYNVMFERWVNSKQVASE